MSPRHAIPRPRSDRLGLSKDKLYRQNPEGIERPEHLAVDRRAHT